MLHVIAVWAVAAAFLGAGVFNALGTPATKSDFVRWGYPAWWGRVTGALEVVCAALIAVLVTREAGLILGAVIVVAAVSTVVRHRDFTHLVPLAVFAVLLGLAGFSS